jgi:hypothetical protein
VRSGPMGPFVRPRTVWQPRHGCSWNVVMPRQ